MKRYPTTPFRDRGDSGRRALLPACLGVLALLVGGCSAEPPVPPTWQFVRVDAAGEPLAPGASGHHCVLDERTGLLWEVKRPESGLHYREGLYTWYHSDKTEHLGEPGVQDGGDCALSRCDTEAFVAAVNAAGLCGRHDWRMPSRDEALTLLDPTRVGKGPTLHPDYFPDAPLGEFWTGTTFRMYPKGAWTVDTIYALDRVDDKADAKRVRLVSGSKDAVKPKGRGR